MVTLEERLQANGCALPIADFQDLLVDLLVDMHGSWSVDELLLHPSDALAYCAAARRKASSSGLPDDLVLRCLIARRKNPNT